MLAAGKQFLNDRILITGASSGIGKATAISLSRQGASLILISRNNKRLEETIDELEGAKHSGYVLDFNNLNEIAECISTIVKKEGPLSGMVHCAGIYQLSPLNLLKIEHYNRVFNINLFSFFELVKGFIKKDNYKEEGASIVAISSVAGEKPSPGLSIYGASKAALNNVIKSLAIELIPKKIRINSVVPAYVNTQMFHKLSNYFSSEQLKGLISQIPLGLGDPYDIASSIIFLLGKKSKWITGTNLVCDGGYLAK